MARELFDYACRLLRSPLSSLASGVSALFYCACRLLHLLLSALAFIASALLDYIRCLPRSLFYSFRNSIPLPGFLSFTEKVNKPERWIYLLYAQKILALLLLASALGYLAI